MRNTVVAVLVVLAGVTANLAPNAPDAQNAAASAAKQTARKESGEATAKVPENPVKTLTEYFRPVGDDELRLSGKSRVEMAQPRRFPIQFLIAAVPDPEKTDLSLYFDRWVESLILAAQYSGYSYDRFWLPWRREAEPENLKVEDKVKYLEWRAARRSQPGLLLFRGGANKPALGIWLVGETPTAGIDAEQFHNAALYTRQLSEQALVEFRILAPTFSGSVTSLLEALHEDLSAEVAKGAVRIATGSASVDSELRKLPNHRTLVNNDAYLLGTMYQTLIERGFEPNQTGALLAEQGTVFGGGFEGFFPSVILYPRDISRLRNLYPETAPAPNTPAAQVEQQQLSLKLHDAESGRDVLPNLSSQTPVSQESALLLITDTLKANGINLVVVTGTNVLDVIFLSRFLRRSSPDVRIVLYDSDLLFVHGTDTLDNYGMLSVSTYPLLAQYGGEANAKTVQFFASNAAEGVYHAARMLMPEGPWPEKDKQPPIWITVVGRNGYNPVDVSDWPEGKIPANPPSRVWVTLFLTCAVLCWSYVGAVFYSWRKKEPLPQWCAELRITSQGGWLSRWKSTHVLFTAAMILLAFLSMAVTAFRLRLLENGMPWTEWSVVALATGAALTAVIVLAGMNSRLWWSALAVAGAAALVAVTWKLLAGGDPAEKFRALRSMELFSGVAPNVPVFLLLLGLGWWSWTNMSRFALVIDRPQCLPCRGNDEVGRQMKALRAWLRQGFLTVDGLGRLIWGMALAVTMLIGLVHGQSVERPLFDNMMSVLLALVTSLLFLAAYAFVRIWQALRALLNSLEMRPIRVAFSGVPPDFSWSPIWQGSARKRNFLLLARALDSLRLLEKTNAQYYPGLHGDVEAFESHAARVFTRAGAGYAVPADDTRIVQRRLARIADRLEEQLTSRRWNLAVSETLDRAAKGKIVSRFHGVLKALSGGGTDVDVKSTPDDLTPEERADKLAAEVVALRYLAFIRYTMLHLRNLLSFQTTTFILVAVALNSYCFQALNLIRWSITMVFLALAGAVVYVFVQMDRDAILSRLSATQADKLGGQFFLRMISIGALPLLTVISSQFPTVGRFLFSWLQPALGALH